MNSLVVGDPDPRIQAWLEPRFERLESLHVPAVKEYQRIYEGDANKPGITQQFNANTWLREVHDLMRPYFSGTIVIDLNSVCNGLADRFAGAIKMVESETEFEHLLDEAKSFLDHLSLPFPNGDTEKTSLARLQDMKWWRKQLNTAIPRIVDQTSRKLGHVHRDADLYVCNAALDLY